MRGCMVAVAVCVASRMGETRVRVSVCGHVPAGCVLFSPCGVRSLCFPEPFFGMFIVNFIIPYSLQL